MGRRDGDRLTRKELAAVQRHLDPGKVTDSSDRTRLRRVRMREPPSPKDVARWSVQEALLREEGHRIWEPKDRGEAARLVLQPPRVLEDLVLRALEALAGRGAGRFLTFTDRLRPRLERLREEAERALPVLGVAPGVALPEGAGAPRLAATMVYRGVRQALEGGRGTVAGVLETLSEMIDEEILSWLRVLRAEGLVDMDPWAEDEISPEAEVSVRVPPPQRAGRIVFMGAGAERRLLFRWLEGETD
ncbi:MAG: hypothetical protein V3U30_02915 [Thermoplasmata archaeon]